MRGGMLQTTAITMKSLILLLIISLVNCKVDRYEIQNNIEDVESALEKGINWLKNEREKNCGWKDTARAVIALLLTEENLEDHEKKLIKKELDFTIALQLRNINSMSVEEMALNVNAMLAACRNPRSFYDLDIIQWIENKEREFPLSPLALLSFCNANVSVASHHRSHLINLMNNGNLEPWSADSKVFAALVFSCFYQDEDLNKPEHASAVLDFQKKKNQQKDGSFGSIYQTALTVQLALAVGDLTDDIQKAIKYLISEQLEDGSFGDILTTYFVLPVLAGKSLVDIRSLSCEDECQERPSAYYLDYDPNVKLESVPYLLVLDDKKEITRSMIVKVPPNSKFLDVMKVAASRDSAYEFKYSGKPGYEIVHSIGGKYNDPELQKYWQLSYSQDNRQIPSSVSSQIRPGVYYSFSYKTKRV